MKSLIPAENWWYSLKDLFQGLIRTYFERPDRHVLEINDVGDCIAVRSGRMAIVLAMNAFGLGSGARIGVPLFTCPAVIKAVVSCGCRPVFIDVEKDSFCLSVPDLSTKIDSLQAVIAIHMFGHLCDMDGILDVARGKPVIEDCAQSLGSRIGGRAAGTMGSIGVFSFRSGKYLSVGEGGALYTRNRRLCSRLLAGAADTIMPSKRSQVVHVCKTYLRTKLRTRPLYGWIGKRVWMVYNRTVAYAAKTPLTKSAIFPADLLLIRDRIKKLQVMIVRQRAYAGYYSSHLDVPHMMLCGEKPGTYYNRFAYPVIFSSWRERDAMAEALLRKKIDTIKPYQDLPAIASDHYDYSGDCPVAEKLCATTLLLPCYDTLRLREIQHIAFCFNSAWKKIRFRNPGEIAVLYEK